MMNIKKIEKEVEFIIDLHNNNNKFKILMREQKKNISNSTKLFGFIGFLISLLFTFFVDGYSTILFISNFILFLILGEIAYRVGLWGY